MLIFHKGFLWYCSDSFTSPPGKHVKMKQKEVLRTVRLIKAFIPHIFRLKGFCNLTGIDLWPSPNSSGSCTYCDTVRGLYCDFPNLTCFTSNQNKQYLIFLFLMFLICMPNINSVQCYSSEDLCKQTWCLLFQMTFDIHQ